MREVGGRDATNRRRINEISRIATGHQSFAPRNTWLVLSLLGFTVVVVALASYDYLLSTRIVAISPQSALLEEDAYATMLLVLVGLVLTFVGITYYLRNLRDNKRVPSVMTPIASILSEKRYARVLALSASAYGVFFAIVSSTLVYQPTGVFSDTYGVHVPSIIPIFCCAAIGQMPQFVIYITQQFAILLIPINIVLLFAVSWLVGLNASVAAFAFKNRPDTDSFRWIGGLGAIIGLFTACPTCAGFFLLSMLGLSGAISLALTLTSLQGLFILTGFPLLLATPLLLSRKLDRCFPSSRLSSKERGNLLGE